MSMICSKQFCINLLVERNIFIMKLSIARVENRGGKDIKEFVNYLLCSVLSLFLDIGTFVVSIRFFGFFWVYAAAIGFLVGSTVAYLGSIFWVFQSRQMANHQGTEFFFFIAIGVCGLALCEFLLWLGITVMGYSPEETRIFASIVTFFFNFLVRKIALFRG